MTEKKANQFAARFNRAESAPGTKAKTATVPKKAASRAEIPAVEPLQKTAATFRLSTRALRLVALAVNESRHKGIRLSKEEAVDKAIRETFGHLEPEG